jgi:hypothetical protein
VKFYPWIEDDEDDSFAWITKDSEFLMRCRDTYQLREGIPVNSWFPGDVVFTLAEDYGIKMTDSIPNTLNRLIVSQKLKGVLEEKSGADIEFLPVHIRDHKGRTVHEPYFIANLLGTVECVDREKSQFRTSAIRPDQIFTFFRLVLDTSKIPPEARIFRLKEASNLVIAREDLADDILNAGCDGMMFLEMEAYGAEFRLD